MNKFLSFDIDSAEMIEESQNSQFATAKIRAFHSGKNLHDLTCSVETLKRTADTIYLKPIVYTVDKRLDDFYTHTDPDKSLICGFVVPNSATFEEVEDGRIALFVVCKIWKKYAPKVIEYFQRDGNHKSVSVEMEVYEAGKTEDPNIDEMLDFSYFAICILGSYVREASPGASMEITSFAKENDKYKEIFEKEFSGKYDDVDFTIPQLSKDFAKKALDEYKERGGKANSVYLAMGRFLLKSEKASPERVRQIHKFFTNRGEKTDLTIGLHGGKESAKWAKEIVDKLDEIDAKKLSFFAEEERVPYKTVDDMNPALKGIEPPITVSQGNEIAKQADAIGSDEKKNGWAIAISSFKKTHVVKDGKWVKKNTDKMSDNSENLSKEEKEVEKEELEKKFSLTASQILDLLSSSLSEYKYGDDGWRKYWAETFDESFVYVSDNENGKTYRMPFIMEGTVAKIDLEKAEEVIRGTYQVISENATFAENTEENPDDGTEKPPKEGKEKEFSLDAYLDVAATLAFLKAETESNEEMAEEYKTKIGMAVDELGKGAEFADAGVVMSALYAYCGRMSEKYSAMCGRMSELEKFKADVENQQKDMAVDAKLKEMSAKVVIPDEKMSEFKEDAKNFSLENLNVWENNCKAKSFDFAAREENKEKHLRIANAWTGVNSEKPKNDIWFGIKK